MDDTCGIYAYKCNGAWHGINNIEKDDEEEEKEAAAAATEEAEKEQERIFRRLYALINVSLTSTNWITKL